MFCPHQPKEGPARTQHDAGKGFAKLNFQRTGKKVEIKHVAAPHWQRCANTNQKTAAVPFGPDTFYHPPKHRIGRFQGLELRIEYPLTTRQSMTGTGRPAKKILDKWATVCIVVGACRSQSNRPRPSAATVESRLASALSCSQLSCQKSIRRGCRPWDELR